MTQLPGSPSEEHIFSSFAHELRTPLTSLLGHAQLLRRRLVQQRSDERKLRNIDVVIAQGERMNRTITQFVDILRLHHGLLDLASQPVDVVAVAERVALEARHTLHGQQLKVEMPPQPLLVKCDAVRLTQILGHLVENAVKFSPQRRAELELRIGADDEQAWVTVVDHGIGIPAEALPRLFDCFYRAPNVHQLQVGGAGIGLYLVKSLVDLQGGCVEVESVEGAGSTFRVSMPLMKAGQPALEMPDLWPSSGQERAVGGGI